MNVQEKVATLEALLARVKKNAAMPRAVSPVGGSTSLATTVVPAENAILPAMPVAQEVKPAVVEAKPPIAEIKPPVAEVKPPIAEVKPPVEEAKPAPVKPTVAPADKPVEAERPRLVALGPPINTPPAKPAAEPAKPVEATKPAVGRPITAPRPPIAAPKVEPPKPTVTAPKPVEKVEPPKPVEKVAAVATKPVEKVEPTKPVEKVAPAATKPVEKVAAAATRPDNKPTVKAMPRVEPSIFAVDKPADKAAPVAKPTPVAARQEDRITPVAAVKDTLPMDFEPVPEPVKIPGRGIPKVTTPEDEELSNEETKLMVGPIPDDAKPPPGEEPTIDEETQIAELAQRDEAAAKAEKARPVAGLPKVNLPEEPEEETRLLKKDRSDQEPSAPQVDVAQIAGRKDEAPKVEIKPPPMPEPVINAPRLDDSPKVTPKPTPVAPDQPVADILATAAKEPTPKPEPVVAPPIRPREPSEPAIEPPRPTGGRSSAITIALVAALLIGAGVFLGLRNGWFDSILGTKPGPGPGTSTSVAPPPSTAKVEPGPSAIETASSAPTVSAPPAMSAGPATSASAAPATSASVAPATSAAAGPEGDGSNLPATRGYIIVHSSVPAAVYLSGIFAGLTDQKLEVECGAKYLRLASAPAPGAAPAKPPTWTSEGKSATVVCKAITNIELNATKP